MMEQQTRSKGLSFDGTVNLPTLVTAVILVATMGMTYAKIEAQTNAQGAEIDELKIAVSKLTDNQQGLVINQAKLTWITEQLMKGQQSP